MPDTVRETAMKALEAVMNTVTIANGFNFDIGQVYRTGIVVQEMQDMDGARAFSMILAEDFEDQVVQGFGPDDLVKAQNNLRVSLECWTQNEDATFEDLNILLGDVQKAVMGNRTLSGTVLDTRLVNNEMLLNEQILPYAGLSQVIELRYCHILADPFAQ